MLLPPSQPGRKFRVWAQRHRRKLRHFHQYLIGGILNLVSAWLKLHPKTLMLIRRALELGNPTATIWPSETIPMTSRLLAGGFWNYSFFQFHRQFYFPYWAHRQYNPRSKSFIPRSHNILSINQTHRNWVSISFPGKTHEVTADMAGAIMPEHDSYTIEFAFLDDSGKLIRPHDDADQLKIRLLGPDELVLSWENRSVRVQALQEGCRLRGEGEENLVISIRPFNMEGPALLYKLQYLEEKNQLRGDVTIDMAKSPEVYQLSTLEYGDALQQIEKLVKKKAHKKNTTHYRLRKKKESEIRRSVKDPLGLATAAFLYNKASDLQWVVHDRKKSTLPIQIFKQWAFKKKSQQAAQIWQEWFGDGAELRLPEPYHSWYQHSRWYLMVLWDFDSITPGSFTYHHFWVRDAVFMLNAFLLMGTFRPVRQVIEKFPDHVRSSGLFHSQAGEWDANGQALWIIARYSKVTQDQKILQEQSREIARMVSWIGKMCEKYGGVLPPGFSAEHLGVADWYLWDNFWALGGLKEIADLPLKKKTSIHEIYAKLSSQLKLYLQDYDYYPAALGRGKDPGMIGSLSALYPLMLTEFMDLRMAHTLDIIRQNYFFRGGFFQENIHSGINPYLTFQVAESYLYLGQAEEAWSIVKKILPWAQKAYTFPEAVHPKTKGGCMGDGFHGWAYAEVVSYFHNILYRETHLGPLFLGGLPTSWLKKGFEARNLPTSKGRISLSCREQEITITGLREEPIFLRIPRGCRFMPIDGIPKKWQAVPFQSFNWPKPIDGLIIKVTPVKDTVRFKVI
ncbi:MAG: hypothetical protein RML34_03140 [Leptospiraceae bacterium]|nr:hypothetical protein [Leptospiraceae bacterium]